MLKPELVFDARDIVGESLVYDDRRDALIWVDIGGRRIHRLWLVDWRHQVWETPDFPTSIGLDRDGGAVVGFTDRVARWAFGGEFETLAVVEPDLPDNRLNEGRVGPDGAFWVGTMLNNLNADGSARDMDRSSGAIYRVTPQGKVTQLTPREFGIANTLAWTQDRRLLTADTLLNEIYAYDIVNGTLANKRLFAGPDPRGAPDGSCLDNEDALWNCRVAGGAGVIRYGRDGSLKGFVDLPCSWPTSCAFGGARFDVLYVTSARFTMSADHLRRRPEEGALFAVRPGVRGRPESRFG